MAESATAASEHEVVGLVALALRPLHDAPGTRSRATLARGMADRARREPRAWAPRRRSRCWRGSPAAARRSGGRGLGREACERSRCRPIARGRRGRNDAGRDLATLGILVVAPQGKRRVSVTAGPPPAVRRRAVDGGHGRLEGGAASLVVAEHVEAGGGRAEQHRRPAPPSTGDAAWLARTASSIEPARSTCSQAGAPRRPRPAAGRVSPMSTAAADALGDDARQLVDGHALGATAGDEHERRREGAQRRR